MVNFKYMLCLGIDFIENYEVVGIDFVIVYVYLDFWYYLIFKFYSIEVLFVF